MLTVDRTIAPPVEKLPSRVEDEPVDIALDEEGISLGESIRLAFASLMANKLRTVLTALGVIIGVMAVIALLAIGKGSQNAITASITANGSNMLTVRGGAANAGGARGQFGSGQTLTIQDAQALADPSNVPAALIVSPEAGGGGQLVAGSQNLGARITGAEPTYQQIHNVTLADGEFITAAEVTSTDNVVVLGANVAQTLFSGGGVGQAVRLDGQTFTVVGVLNVQGGSGFGSVDDGVIVPISTAQRMLFGDRAITAGGGLLVQSIVVQARDQNSITAALDQISTTLRDRHQLPANGAADDFNIINQQDILNTALQSTKVLTLFLGAIAAISLLVGGIGIMNIMLVSVRERTREIGLRKALGAREKDILTQFLIEALTLSTGGGVIGCLLGMLIAVGVNQSGIVQAQVAPLSVLMAIAFAMAVGLFFGIEPARRAAALSPIVALRYD